MPVVVRLLFRSECERYPESCLRIRKLEVPGHHADDREGPASQSNLLPDGVRPGAIELLPQTVAQDHFLLAADLTFGIVKNAALYRRDFQQAKQRRGRCHSADQLG